MKAAKAWYACYFAALSTLFPFFNLFFRRLGLTERQIGAIGAARPLISLPAGSLWSGVADKSRRHRAVLLLTFVASVLVRLSTAAVGKHGFGPLMAVVLLTEFFAAPVTIIVDSAVMAACNEQGDYGRQRLFGALGWGAMAAVSGGAISHAGIRAAFACHTVLAAVALLPTLRLPFGPLHARLEKQEAGVGSDGSWEDAGDGGGAAVGAAGAAAGYTQQEPGAARNTAAGTAAAAITAGAGSADTDTKQAGGRRSVERFDSALEAQTLLHHSHFEGAAKAGQHGSSSRDSSTGSPVGSSEGGGLADPGSPGARHKQRQQRQGQKGQPRVRYWHGMLRLLSDPEAAIFLCMAIIMGFGVGNIESYLFLFINDLGGSELLMGLSLSVTCAAETLVFYFLPSILRLGIRRCMHLVFAAFLLRMGCYSMLKYAPSPWLVLPVEVLHGFTFALAWGGGCAYCAQLSPPGLEATTQGLFQGLYFGLGVAAGSFVGGHVYQRHGAQAVYLVACAVLAAGWLACSLAQLAVGLLGVVPQRDRYLIVADVEGDVEMSTATS